MGHRLSKIYTRTGDDGTTGLGDGSRIPKDSPRVEAYGTVDELNATVGMVLAEEVPGRVRDCLLAVQHRLFDLGGELCIPGHTAIAERHVKQLEDWLDAFNEDLPPLKDFILPGGGRAATCCHLARTVCRRTERVLVTLAREEAINAEGRRYLNRLSDLLFVLCRVLAREAGEGEQLWEHDR